MLYESKQQEINSLSTIIKLQLKEFSEDVEFLYPLTIELLQKKYDLIISDYGELPQDDITIDELRELAMKVSQIKTAHDLKKYAIRHARIVREYLS